MEPRACLVSYSAADDCYDIWVCSQGITMMRWQFSVLTGLPEDKLRFHLHDNGGGFGQRAAVYPEYAAQMIASRKLGRPVKWISSRSESFLSDSHGRGVIINGELALDADARFLAARYRFNCDMGAYLTPTAANSHVRNPSICTTGVYRIPALAADFKVVFTNTVPVAAYRGAGRPDMAYAIERLVDQAAHDLKLPRDEIRRRNFIPPDAFPYKTPTLGVYEKSDFAGCLAQALSDADWSHFEARRDDARRRGALRGIGLSTVIEGTAPGAAPKDQVLVEFDATGTMTLFVACLSSGQGHETTFTKIFSDALGIANENVTLRESAHDRALIGNFSGGSRSLVGAGSVCQLAAKKLIEHARPFAAEALELEPSQVDYVNGAYRSRDGSLSINMMELAAQLAGRQPHPLNTMAEATVGATYPNGCHVAEVEIDPETGVTRIVNYTTADDCGNVMNHTIVEGQVHGGVVQGAGQVFGEHAVYDEDSGQLLAGSFGDYFMPHAGFVPVIRVGDHAVPSAGNALGAKGAGESGCTASIPAMVSAVLDALRPLGITHLDMPLTPDKVWRAIKATQA
jgi:carbon-monoxide dehydrogenase large subunit